MMLLAVAGYAGALALAVRAWRGCGRPEAVRLWFAAGFAANLVAIAVAGVRIGHLPLTNVGEVMMAVAACGYPAWRLYRRSIPAPLLPVLAAGMALLLGLHPALRGGAAKPLSPSLDSAWFIPHIAAYMLAYALCFLAAGFAAYGLWRRREVELQAADRFARHAFPLLTFGLLAGAFWAQAAWGDYWRWDPKENWALITWLAYAAGFHLPTARGRAGWYLAGAGAIMMTMLAVSFIKLFAGQHSYGG
ncbi:MAG TPA: cytochrome c biogenesis protein CcsA [bacterium]|nr:cytochrome c biogenesis protein CcsA [bacterium]